MHTRTQTHTHTHTHTNRERERERERKRDAQIHTYTTETHVHTCIVSEFRLSTAGGNQDRRDKRPTHIVKETYIHGQNGKRERQNMAEVPETVQTLVQLKS